MRAHLLFASSLAAAAGCFGSPAIEDRFPRPSSEPLVGTVTRAASCEDLTARFRADALAKLDIEAYGLIQTATSAASTGPFIDGPFFGTADAGVAVDAPAASPPTAGPTAAAGADSEVRFTETNTQVAGIDEADFVETDGAHVYLLHDAAFYVFDTDPPGSVAEQAKVSIEGSPTSMFVANGRAVVFSSIYGSYPGPYAGAPIADLPYPYPYYYTEPETKVTILDVTGPSPTVVSERFLGGSFLDARRDDATVRVFVSTSTYYVPGEPAPSYWETNDSGWRIVPLDEYLTRLEVWRDAERVRIASAQLSDFVHPDEDVVDGARTDMPIDCTGFFLAPPAESSSGLTRVISFSMADPTATDVVAVSGYAGVEYQSDDTVVLVEPDYRWDRVTGIAYQESAVHVLGVEGLGLAFLGSARIDGNVMGSYSIDESDGVVRIVSTEQQNLDSGGSQMVSLVSTYSASGGVVSRLGKSEDLGVGETVRAVRYVDDTAYVVTFRNVDPLFVVDLRDATRPTLRGELTIPGFSTYLHPLDATHLLAIGQSPMWGVALQIFDVSDPASPKQDHVLTLDSASSDAQYDPHAFVFDAVTGLLAIPVSSYASYAFKSELRLFHVSVDAGITPVGAIDHTAYYGNCVDPTYGYYYCNYTANVRRGLFIGDYVYTVSNRAVTATPLATLSSPSGAITLPEPMYWYTPWYATAEF